VLSDSVNNDLGRLIYIDSCCMCFKSRMAPHTWCV